MSRDRMWGGHGAHLPRHPLRCAGDAV